MAFLRTARRVSVTGLPGMGKTEVALAVARKAIEDSSLGYERALWIALDGVTRAESLRGTLASAFGVSPDECKDDAAIARRIGDTRALLVLDNAEDPIRGDRGGMRALVDRLLRECKGLSFVLGTRELLGDLPGGAEHEVHVGQLSPRDAEAVFLSVAGVRLEAGERGSAELAKLLKWLDGHPLSLVLVARQVGTMRLGALLKRLEAMGAEAVHSPELFGEQATGESGERLMRLASSLSLSYRPLAEKVPGAAEMFAWLGHFPAGLAEALVPEVFGEEGLERRAILLRRGLAEEVGREKRLVLPAPVRAYARARGAELPEARRMKLVEASFRAMAQWMGALHQRLNNPGAREAMDTAARDAENVSALLKGVPKSGESKGTLADVIADTVKSFAHVMKLAGRAQAAAMIACDALAVVERVVHVAHSRAVANVRKALGDLYVRTARLKEAEAAYDKALPQYQAIDARLGPTLRPSATRWPSSSPSRPDSRRPIPTWWKPPRPCSTPPSPRAKKPSLLLAKIPTRPFLPERRRDLPPPRLGEAARGAEGGARGGELWSHGRVDGCALPAAGRAWGALPIACEAHAVVERVEHSCAVAKVQEALGALVRTDRLKEAEAAYMSLGSDHDLLIPISPVQSAPNGRSCRLPETARSQ